MTSPGNREPYNDAFLAIDAKKVMTSFDLQAIADELKTTIIGARIDNIYQFSHLGLLISLHPTGNLILEAGRRVHLSRYSIERPSTPSLFCSILRRHLRQGRVEELGIEGFERVFHLRVSSTEGLRKLVVEVFSGGNILLLDEKGTIIQALTYRRMRDRNILRGEIYKLPPPRGISPDQVTPSELLSLKNQKGDTARALGRTLSLGSPYVEEILLRGGIAKSLPVAELGENDTKSIYNAICTLIGDLKNPQPRIVTEESGGWLDVVPFPLLLYKTKASVEFGNYNDAADVYFTRLSTELEKNLTVAGTEAQIEEQKRILDQQQARLKELELEASSGQRAGDLLYIHFSMVQELLDLLRQEKEVPDKWRNIVVSIDPTVRKASLRLEDQEVELNLRKSVYENAKNHYERTKNARQKTEGLRRAIEEAEKKFNLREVEKTSIDEQLPKIIRERAWYEKFHWTRTKDGALIIGGRDAITNEILVKKHIESNDLVFHADTPGAPFVLLKAPNGNTSEEDIMEAAQMSASYSHAWKARTTSTDVYWIKPEQVSKEAPTGEYLTRGSFMIRGQKNYIRNVQLRISLGLIEGSHGFEVIGGSLDAVQAQTKLAVEIVPGRTSSGALAKEIRKRLSSKKPELKALILATPLEELQRFIPPGGGEIVSN